MSRVFLALAFCAAASLQLSPAIANEPRSPTGQWVIDFADHQCTASQQFGTKEEPALLVLRPSLGGDVMQLAMIGKGKQSVTENQTKLILSDGTIIDVRELQYGAAGKTYRLINLDAEQRTKVAASTSLGWLQDRTWLVMKVPALGQVAAKLDECRRDLRSHWNANGEASFQRAAVSGKPLVEYFKSTDYPREAVSDDKQGASAFVLLIDEKGVMRDCMVEQTSGVPVLDMMACIVLRERATFQPALDADGKPVKSTIQTRINWRLRQARYLIPIRPVLPPRN